MKNKYIFIIFLFSVLLVKAQTPNANVINDNGKVSQTYINSVNFEEVCLLKPSGPCKLKTVYVYLSGTAKRKDTIRIIGDPGDGGLPSTYWVNEILPMNDYINFIVDYQGKSGWVALDASSANIYLGGGDRIGVEHIIKSGGPSFVVDNAKINPAKGYSYLIDVFTPNTQFYNIPGTIIYTTTYNYLVRLEVEYLYPDSTSSQKPPQPSLIDVTKSAGLVNSSGVVMGSDMASAIDWNNDGYTDIAIGNNFFENNKNGTFTNVSSKFNVSCFGTMWGDIDNDGFVDFFAASGGLNDKIYWGNSDGTFIENTDKIIKIDQPTVTPLLFDYNKDGLLDIYIAYGRTADANGNETYYPDKLYKNLGNRKFLDVTDEAGITIAEYGNDNTPKDCWGASVCDFNKDGFPDIFVAQYRLAPDLLLKNNGDGTFTDVGESSGARGIPTYQEGYFGHGMGSDWGDYNNDGYDDLAVGNLGHPDQRGIFSNPSLIFKNNGNETFTDNRKAMGLKFYEMNSGVCWLDLNNDTYSDLISGQIAYYAKGNQGQPDKNTRIYKNLGELNNFKLQDMTWEYGAWIHGCWSPIRLDYDNDGDMDLLLASSTENVKLFRNDITPKGNFVEFIIKGDIAKKENSLGFGSRVNIITGGLKFTKYLPGTISNARASQSSSVIHFGLANFTKIDTVELITSKNNKYVYTSIDNKNIVSNKIYTLGSNEITTEVEKDISYKNLTTNTLSSTFSNQNTIKIQLMTSLFGNYNIGIYDILGNKVDNIYFGKIESNEANFNFSTKNLTNNIYFIRAVSENNILINKIIINR